MEWGSNLSLFFFQEQLWKLKFYEKKHPCCIIYFSNSFWMTLYMTLMLTLQGSTDAASWRLSLPQYLSSSFEGQALRSKVSSNLIHTPSRAKSRDLNCVNFELWKLVMHFRRYCMKNCTLCTSMLQSQMLQIWTVTMKAFHINTWSTKLVGCMVKCQRGENPWWMQIWSLNIYRSKSLCCLWKFSISCQL